MRSRLPAWSPSDGPQSYPFAKRTLRMTYRDRTDDSALLELDRYGIEVVPAKAYLWGGYKYTNARDALAAAKRGEKQ